jgi:hypothetical protein
MMCGKEVGSSAKDGERSTRMQAQLSLELMERGKRVRAPVNAEKQSLESRMDIFKFSIKNSGNAKKSLETDFYY